MILRLNKGEEVIASIIAYCQSNSINSAWISGIGSCREITLAYFNVDTKEYSERHFEGIFEIASLIGNIGTMNGNPTAHIHSVISDQNMTPLSGHLVKATVAATCELKIDPLDQKITRKFNDEIGLNLIEQ